MHENNAPANLWSFALRYSALIFNYSLIKSNDWMSPYELVFGEKPDYKRLYPFYCPGLYYLHKEERSNTAFPDYKAKSCYFLGYLEESPVSFVVKDVISGRVLVRDICDAENLVQIDDIPEPILYKLQDLRISTQNQHEKTEKLAAEKSLTKRLHRKSSADSLSLSHPLTLLMMIMFLMLDSSMSSMDPSPKDFF
jgi:hypothetical protein